MNKDYYFFFSKHLFFTFFALGVMIFISIIETSFLKKIIIPSFVISFILLALVPVIGIEVKGAKRWLDLYLFRLQPIEVLKPFFILASVKILTSEKFRSSNLKYTLSFLLLSSVIILLIDQPDLGQSILLILSWTATVFISGVSFLFIIGFFSFFLISISSLIFTMPEKFGYIINRLISFIDPSQGDKFQSSSALDSIKLGGLKGQGMGEGILKIEFQRLTQLYYRNNFEYGSVISVMIILIFFISSRIIKNCVNQEDKLIKFSLCGLASLLIFQTFIHIGMQLNFLGITLPFLSYGGSH